jgi:hypothetical protein
MIDKAVLDAVAVVIREERSRTDQLIEERMTQVADDLFGSVKDGTNGRDGIDGRDGADGKDGARGADGVRGSDGTNGIDGADGRDGTDGRNGTDGSPGTDGIDRDMVAPCYPASHDVLERGTLAYSQGGLYQAVRKTIGCPQTDPNGYRLVLNGLAKIISERDDAERVTRIKAMLSDGSCETVEVPHGTDGAKGEQGAEGIRGRKGLKGDPGIGIEDAFIDRGHLLITMTSGEVKTWKLDMPQPEVTVKMHGVHAAAPDDPPVDYLWVSPNGRTQIWSGDKWIKLI